MNGRALEAVFGIISIFIAFIMFGLVMTGSHDILTDPDTDAFANVTTGVGETAADVVLTEDLYNSSTGSVTSLVSSLETDTPVAATYTSATNTLHVTGLTAEQTRTLTVAYEYGATDDYTGLGSIVKLGPLVLFLGLLALGVALIWKGVKGG